jgi:KAP family P-loop domain
VSVFTTERLDSPGLRWVLTDRVDEENPEDLLQHRAVADAITLAIRSAPLAEPLGIALYGSWGQGKTTIGMLIRQAFADDIERKKVAFIRINAWKYAYEGQRDPLRRHYLLQAYEGIGRRDIADTLRRQFKQVVTTEVAAPATTLRQRAVATWAALRTLRFDSSPWVGVALLAILTLILFPRIRHELGVFFSSILAALLIAASVTGALATAFVRLFVGGLTVRAEEDPFSSVEEFDRQFDSFLTKEGQTFERFIFFIDDLDRCDDSLVIEALETLQAFFGQARCVFIVAADEKQLKRAVRLESQGPARAAIDGAAIPPDETFLEKIFQLAVYVPPLFSENLANYARVQVRETIIDALAADERDQLLSYLIHTEVSSPRQVKVILSDFLVTLAQVRRREEVDETHLSHKPLSRELLLVAKMVVLRSHFPWFFELLTRRPQVLLIYPETLERPPNLWTPEQAQVVEWVEAAAKRAHGESEKFVKRGVEEVDEEAAAELDTDTLVAALRGYLLRTRATTPSDAVRVQEFVYLRSPDVFGGLIGSAGSMYRTAIVNGDLQLLSEAMAADISQIRAAAEFAIRQATVGFGIERDRAVEPLAALAAILEGDALEAIAPRAVELLSEKWLNR